MKATFFYGILGILLGWSCNTFAQQDPQYTQYMYNTIVINPAYAGSREVMSILGLHRTQWVGLEGAPVTNAASVHTPLGNSRLGLGVSFLNDRIGPSDASSLSMDLSYFIKLNQEYKLAFGLKGTLNMLNVNFSRLNAFDPTDPQYQNNIDNRLSPNIGAGIYWYSNKTYLGLSVPNFLESEFFDSEAISVVSNRLHYYFIGGYVADLSSDVKFKPAFLMKAVEGAPLQTDLSANFMYREKWVLGAAYRWGAAVSAMAGFQVSETIFIGYTYDTETTRLSDYNSGSHEIFLRFELFSSCNCVVTPRFF